MILGIDPGKKGALAMVSKENAMVFPMPETERDTAEFFRNNTASVERIFIEIQTPMKGWGVTGPAQQQRGYGILLGCIAMLRIPYEKVKAAEWQRSLSLPPATSFLKGSKPVDEKAKKSLSAKRKRLKKKAHIALAQELYPDIKITASKDGLADALLIATYGLRRA